MARRARLRYEGDGLGGLAEYAGGGPAPSLPHHALTAAHALHTLQVVAEAAAAAAAGGDSAQFVAPTPGISAAHRWQTKTQLAAQQVRGRVSRRASFRLHAWA